MNRLSKICLLVLIITISFNCNNLLAADVPRQQSEQAKPGTPPSIEEPVKPEAPPTIEGQAAVVIDASGRVLYKKNEHVRMYPASTTKMLTALVAMENSSLDDVMTVGSEITLPNTGGCGLKQGEAISLRELMYALLLRSGNDAAMTIAVNVARNAHPDKTMNDQEAVAAFARMMNQRAVKIGARQSHFVNPHGLSNPKHYSTAYDLALIGREAMKNSYIKKVVATPVFRSESRIDPQTGQGVVFLNTNRLINKQSQYYLPDAIGIKTGYTDEAGNCLVSATYRDNLTTLAVVLHTSPTGMWTDSIALLNYGFTKQQSMPPEEVKSTHKAKTAPLPLPSIPKWLSWGMVLAALAVSIIVGMGFRRMSKGK